MSTDVPSVKDLIATQFQIHTDNEAIRQLVITKLQTYITEIDMTEVGSAKMLESIKGVIAELDNYMKSSMTSLNIVIQNIMKNKNLQSQNDVASAIVSEILRNVPTTPPSDGGVVDLDDDLITKHIDETLDANGVVILDDELTEIEGTPDETA